MSSIFRVFCLFRVSLVQPVWKHHYSPVPQLTDLHPIGAFVVHVAETRSKFPGSERPDCSRFVPMNSRERSVASSTCPACGS